VTSHFLTAIFGQVASKPIVPKAAAWKAAALATELAIAMLRRSFDITTMARLSVGSSWATLSEAQRHQVVESFGRYISAIYADRFDSYAGQKLQVTGEQPAAGGIMVKSQACAALARRRRVPSIRCDAAEW